MAEQREPDCKAGEPLRSPAAGKAVVAHHGLGNPLGISGPLRRVSVERWAGEPQTTPGMSKTGQLYLVFIIIRMFKHGETSPVTGSVQNIRGFIVAWGMGYNNFGRR